MSSPSVVIDVAPELGHAEPDPEIQYLLAASPGMNLGTGMTDDPRATLDRLFYELVA